MFMSYKFIKFGLLSFLTFSVLAEESFIPDPPSLNSTNYILMDSISGRILAEKGADERIEPASITKIMTGYVAVDQVDKGYVSLNDEVLISENCWRKEGSKMFIREGTKVLFSDLMKGMVIQSGNELYIFCNYFFIYILFKFPQRIHNSGMRVGGQILNIILLPEI